MDHDLFSYAQRPDPYPGSPGYKDTDTSRLAARAVASTAQALRDQCLFRVARNGDMGLTADEAAKQLGASPFSIRPRFTELLRAGLIRDSGKRRRNESGSTAKVWVVVTAQ